MELSSPSASGERPLAAFDFDGTLTVRDSFSGFLRWRATPRGWALGGLRLLPHALVYLVRRDRGRLKSAAIRVFLRGVTREALASEARRFANEHWDGLMRPDALRTWAAHGARGDRRVIVTASPEEVVRPFAERLGADVLIGSSLDWTGEERVGDGLCGPNCRGVEKVERLRARFGADVRPINAYGDTAGDREMLALAERGHMRVFRARPPG